jgi:hypothetical protein
MTNPIRSVIAVLVGFVLFSVLSQVMATAFVASVVGPITTYMDVAPGLLAAVVAVQGIAGLLAGYMAARIAGEREWQHGAVLAGLFAVLSVWSFAVTPEAAQQVPRWMQVATVVVVAGAMFAGAAVRGRAAVHSDPAAVRPGERS